MEEEEIKIFSVRAPVYHEADEVVVEVTEVEVSGSGSGKKEFKFKR